MTWERYDQDLIDTLEEDMKPATDTLKAMKDRGSFLFTWRRYENEWHGIQRALARSDGR